MLAPILLAAALLLPGGTRAETPAPEATPPTVRILYEPSSVTTETTPLFTWDASESGLVYTCRYDGEPFRPCSGAYGDAPALPLSFGPHTFTVKAARGTEEGTDSRSFQVVERARIFRVSKTRFHPETGAATLAFFVRQPGTFTLSGVGVRPARVSTATASPTVAGLLRVEVPVKPTKKLRAVLRREGSAGVTVRVWFETEYQQRDGRERKFSLKLDRG